jgi:hypothetical protein
MLMVESEHLFTHIVNPDEVTPLKVIQKVPLSQLFSILDEMSYRLDQAR